MHLTINILLNGENTSIDFDGGITSPRRINGSFSTTNPKIQAALESHYAFNKSFELVRTVDSSPAPVVKKEEEQKETKSNVIISRAKNAQEARQELNKKYGISYSYIKNAAAVLEKAAEFNIEYPNWERDVV